MIELTARLLVSAQNADGGWGPYPRRASMTEATALATLALSTIETPAARASARRGVEWLDGRQLEDGAWPVSDRVREPSWMTGIATFALAVAHGERDRLVRARAWLIQRLPAPAPWTTRLLYRLAPGAMTVRLNPELRGWPWAPGTASFVQPTVDALLALRRVGVVLDDAEARDRIEEAEALLRDRMCPGGGWNYGNSRVLDEDLPPFADMTALALIALQRHAARPDVRQSLELLPRLMLAVRSGLALAWGTICLAVYGRETAAWRRRLLACYNETGFLGETRVIALALLAGGDPGVFRAS